MKIQATRDFSLDNGPLKKSWEKGEESSDSKYFCLAKKYATAFRLIGEPEPEPEPTPAPEEGGDE